VDYSLITIVVLLARLSLNVLSCLPQLGTLLLRQPEIHHGDKIVAASKQVTAIGQIAHPVIANTKTLFLSNNLLSSLDGIEQLSRLGTLSLANNDLASLLHLERLRSLPSLQHLTVSGNPLCFLPYYRERVLFMCEHLGLVLMTLDGKHVTAADTCAAKAVTTEYAARLSSLLIQEARIWQLAMLHKHFSVMTDIQCGRHWLLCRYRLQHNLML
jgi:hypothetical protein